MSAFFENFYRFSDSDFSYKAFFNNISSFERTLIVNNTGINSNKFMLTLSVCKNIFLMNSSIRIKICVNFP